VTVTLEDGVFELWETYNKSLSYDLLTPALDERLYGTYGRLPNLALKVATIMAALTWKGGDAAPRIDLPHLHRAMLITESWRASAHRTLDLSTTAEENIKLGRLVQKIGAAGLEGITVRDLNKAMSNVTRDEMDRLIEQALAANEIEPVQAPTGATGGRPTVRYRVTVE
jgi:hypothetical protein